MVNRNAPLYINRNEVQRRLGTNMHVHRYVILLTISQITLRYISRHPHPSSSHEARS
jgi:hypothetical protein